MQSGLLHTQSFRMSSVLCHVMYQFELSIGTNVEQEDAEQNFIKIHSTTEMILHAYKRRVTIICSVICVPNSGRINYPSYVTFFNENGKLGANRSERNVATCKE